MSTGQIFMSTSDGYAELKDLGKFTCCGMAACSCMQLTPSPYDSAMIKKFGMNSLEKAMVMNASHGRNKIVEGYRAVNRSSRGGHGTVYAHYD